jgi:ATP-dependent DNA helicase RecG
MERQLSSEIETYRKTLDGDGLDDTMAHGSNDVKIIALLRENPQYTTRALAASIGLSVKGVEKQLAKLKSIGRISRIGPARGGYWQVNE